MTSIYIENERLDISADIEALLTMSLDDIADFGSRNTTWSKTIVVPGTARNNQLFGHLFDVRISNDHDADGLNVATNFNPARRARCYIFQDNIQAFKGWLRVLEVVSDRGMVEYEVAMFGELYGLVNAIGRGKLEDLDFSAYDHAYTIENIRPTSQVIGNATGFVYPLIDYGNGYGLNPDYPTTKHDWQYKTFRPALHVKEYLDKIFDAAGFTYDCNLFATDRFKRLVVPYNRKELTKTTRRAASGEKFAFQALSDTVPITQQTVDFDTVSAGLFTYSGGTFTWPGSDKPFEINIIVQVAVVSTTATTFAMFVNGVKDTSSEVTFPSSPGGQVYRFEYTVNRVLANGDDVTFKFESPASATYDVFADACTVAFLSAAPEWVPLSLNDDVVVNDCIPRNVYQRDFLVSILKLFNLYVYEDPGKLNHVRIAPYVDFYDLDPANSINWTYKLDRSQPVRLTPMALLNSRFYNFKFKPDVDYYNDLYQKRYNETYGDRVFDSAFDFEDGSTDVEIIFSPTVLVGYQGEDKVYSTILKLTNDIEEAIDSNIRILQLARVTGVTSWDIQDSDTVLGTYTEYIYAGHLNDPDAPSNDIHWGAPQEFFFTLASGDISPNQFNVYWSSYMAEITDKDSKVMTAFFKLTLTDIVNLDFSKLIYIDGAYWRINRIVDFNATNPGLTKVELIKVISLSYT